MRVAQVAVISYRTIPQHQHRNNKMKLAKIMF